jgi:hypothetical protein
MTRPEKPVFKIMLRNLLFLFVSLHWHSNLLFANNESVHFSEKVNLAMRRTAHYLLIANGDSSTTIPPVEQIDANTFSVKIGQVLDYEKLPALLQTSLQMQHITTGYNVAVFNCENGKLELGYNFLDLDQKGGVPCGGRQNAKECYLVKVTFDVQKPETAGSGQNWFMLSLGGALAGLGLIAWNKTRAKKVSEMITEKPTFPKLEFGGSYLDIQNQTLVFGTHVQQLTYRETKLLSLFARHTNQVLERDVILKSVWEDEGVTVGRSVDVFVSRLRKMLANDPHLKIAAVHGVGYKMEVRS